MTRFFEYGTVMAEMERQMTMTPNFAPCGHGSAVLCRYRPAVADVDCRNCLEHRRRSCRSLSCLSSPSGWRPERWLWRNLSLKRSGPVSTCR